jgi:hypothetical protein
MQAIPSLDTYEPQALRADHDAYWKRKALKSTTNHDEDQRDLDTNKGTAYLTRKMYYYRFPAAAEGPPSKKDAGQIEESDVAKGQQSIGAGRFGAQFIPPAQGDIFQSGANAGQAQNNGGNTLSQLPQSSNNAGVNMAQAPSLQDATNGTIGPQYMATPQLSPVPQLSAQPGIPRYAPSLQGATNGTIGPQGNDATFIGPITSSEPKYAVAELDKSSFWLMLLWCFLPIILLGLFLAIRSTGNRSR